MDDKELIENNEKEKSEDNTENKDFVFMREQIKSHPVNKGKLAKSTLVSAISALVFGLVACVTFFVLAPIVSGYFEKDDTVEEAVKPVVFPEETIEEETNPEDMLITNEPEIDLSEIAALSEEEIAKALSSVEFSISDYQKLYQSLSDLAQKTERSLVRVRTVTTDTDWFNNMFEETSELSGLVVADNGVNLFIVTYAENLNTADEIYVTFANDVTVKAFDQMKDEHTGLCILTVPRLSINEATRKGIDVATLGISNTSKLVGSLVIAIGSPMGSYGSLNYGMITAANKNLRVVDHQYRQMTTDIYGSSAATGVIINLKGEVIGIIDTKYSDPDTKNLISAIGISELKKTIEKMINNQDLIYFGVTGSNVPEDAVLQYAAPRGSFVLSVEMDSPAMVAGIQAGDIIVSLDSKSVGSYSDVVAMIRDLEPDIEIPVIVSRFSQGEYKNINLSVTPRAMEQGE